MNSGSELFSVQTNTQTKTNKQTNKQTNKKQPTNQPTKQNKQTNKTTLVTALATAPFVKPEVRLEPRRSATARVAAPAKEEKLMLPALSTKKARLRVKWRPAQWITAHGKRLQLLNHPKQGNPPSKHTHIYYITLGSSQPAPSRWPI